VKTDRPIDQIDYPKTAGEWWALFDLHKQEMLDLTSSYHPWYRIPHPEHKITAGRAEVVRQVFATEFASDESECPEARFHRYATLRDSRMVELLNQVWFGMPESMESRDVIGFGVLCDLCSEGYVLEEIEQEENAK